MLRLSLPQSANVTIPSLLLFSHLLASGYHELELLVLEDELLLLVLLLLLLDPFLLLLASLGILFAAAFGKA